MRNINPPERRPEAAWLTALFPSDSPGIDTPRPGAASPQGPPGCGAYTSGPCQRLGSAFTELTAVMAVSRNGAHELNRYCFMSTCNIHLLQFVFFFCIFLCKASVLSLMKRSLRDNLQYDLGPYMDYVENRHSCTDHLFSPACIQCWTHHRLLVVDLDVWTRRR